MKLTLTKEELLNILSNDLDKDYLTEKLRQYFGAPTLEWGWSNDWKNKLKDIPTTFPNMTGLQKNPAIKELRIRCAGILLAEAKYAVENWDKWFGFVKANDRLPEPGYINNGILK